MRCDLDAVVSRPCRPGCNATAYATHPVPLVKRYAKIAGFPRHVTGFSIELGENVAGDACPVRLSLLPPHHSPTREPRPYAALPEGMVGSQW